MAEIWDSSKLAAKMQENPSLWSSLPEEWRAPVAGIVLADKGMRKLNRISGRLKRGAVSQFQNAADVAASLDATILGRYALLRFWCSEKKPNEQQFYINNQLLTAMAAAGTDDEVVSELTDRLDAQWKERNLRSNVIVIAHRGDGATFEKVRKVYERQLFDSLFYTHENENSEAAVVKALDAWRQKKLSGVECDVWFSQDRVPVVTHTQHIEALYQQEQDKTRLPSGGVRINQVNANSLPPRFLTLDRWLQIVEAYVGVHSAELTGDKMLRLEIEMKDTNLAFGGGVPQDTKTAVLERWRAIERVVSRFLKSCNRPSLYQVALFNGSEAPKSALDKAMGENKTLRSSVVYGGSPVDPDTAGLQEVRYGLHSSGLLRMMYSGKFAGRIVTLAPGVEALPVSLDMTTQLSTLGEWIENIESLTVEQAIQCARLRVLLDLFDQMKTGALPVERKPLRIQVLTDFCSLGAKFIVKKRATPIAKGLFSRPYDVNLLRCVWQKYGLDKPDHQDVRQRVCEALNTCGSDQEKLIEFGSRFLQLIGDWYN
ncbi:hypothetical protein JQX13_15520 [Archangium violaceum]|uniref:hypothetical protein n=1 Tax=Archangium violaceum TaxID=83451 RepID=UPI00193B7A39|nr:hypothetical protein [Archangium violaceum]QRK11352.1 hypothetical protein JQX13_15520 [Archangium violaceum]